MLQRYLSILAIWSSLLGGAPVDAQTSDPPDVLIVVAHPDDDAMFAASVYKITHALGGNVDLALVTDGSGGYRYSHLAEPIYHIDLTDEAVARQHLPAIRKRELMAGGAIVGIRNYFFIDEYDHQYTENADTVLQYVWNADAVRGRLQDIMERGSYDFVFAHLPIRNFHGHHKAATILALQAARDVNPARRPVVLGSFVASRSDTTSLFQFRGLEGFPVTAVTRHTDPFVFDRMEPLDPDGRLNYQIVVNWLIAEHKSQGTMQLLVNRGDIERFWFFDANDEASYDRTTAFFEALSQPVIAGK